jgi:hypothetical protein
MDEKSQNSIKRAVLEIRKMPLKQPRYSWMDHVRGHTAMKRKAFNFRYGNMEGEI